MNEELIKQIVNEAIGKAPTAVKRAAMGMAIRLYHARHVAPLAGQLTRPLIGIENRTAQEVFDIMCDRIRAAFGTGAAPQPCPDVARLVEAVEAYGKALDGAAIAPKNSLAFMKANKAVGEALAPFQQEAK